MMSISPLSVDYRITDAIVSMRGQPWDSLMQFVTVFGDTMTLVLVGLAVFAISWVGGRIDLSIFTLVGSVSGYLLMLLLKLILGRPRPPEPDRMLDIGSNSLPSGHAMMSSLIYGFAAVALYALYPAVRRRVWRLMILGAVLVGLVGFSRVYLGVHWASDVVIGWILGLIWLGLSVAAMRQFNRPLAVRSVRLRPKGRAREVSA